MASLPLTETPSLDTETFFCNFLTPGNNYLWVGTTDINIQTHRNYPQSKHRDQYHWIQH